MAENYNRNSFDDWLARQLNRIHIDPVLLSLLLSIMGFGLIILYSAGGQSEALMGKQISRLVAGLIAMTVIAQVSIERMRWFAPFAYAIGLLALVLVSLVGTEINGAQRWLNLGFFNLQSSELLKLALPLALAAYLHDKRTPPQLRDLIACMILIAMPVALIIIQPDLGTSLLIAASGIFVIFLAGIQWRWILSCLTALAVAAPLIWQYVMKPYQQQRVLTMLNPESDPQGAGYHIIQSKIAIGSGGVFGKGWLNGTQSQLDFLPERSTDFIFSVAAEEFGLLGVLPLLALYLAVVVRGLHIATMHEGSFERVLAGSLSLTFFVYVMVNIGMVSGLLPVVGVPLPLISYGGSSMVTLLAGFGILMAIKTQPRYRSI